MAGGNLARASTAIFDSMMLSEGKMIFKKA